MKFNSKVQPAILPEQDEIVPDGANVLIAGWGDNGGIQFPKHLQKANLTTINVEDCNNLAPEYYPGFQAIDSNMCVVTPEEVHHAQKQCVVRNNFLL